MRQKRVLRIDAAGNLIDTCGLRKNGSLISHDAVVHLNGSALTSLDYVHSVLGVLCSEKELDSNLLRVKISDVENGSCPVLMSYGHISSRAVRLADRNNLNLSPCATQTLLPGGNLAGNLVVIRNERLITRRLRIVVLVHIVSEHPVRCEVACHLSHSVLHILNP